MEELTSKLGQQQNAAQECKENIKQEIIKEEENSSGDSNIQIKEECINTSTIKKEGEEESENNDENAEDKDKGNASSPTTKKENVKQEKGVVKKEAAVKTEKEHREAQRAKEAKIAESEIVKDLRFQLK